MSIESYVQLNYDQVQRGGLPGDLSDINPVSTASFITYDTPIEYGIAISFVDEVGNSIRAKPGIEAFSATAGFVTGVSELVDTDISNWNEIDAGGFNIRINENLSEISALTFTGASSLVDVASTIELGLQAVSPDPGGYAAATCEWDDTEGNFVITSGTTGEGSSVARLEPATAAATTDISELLGLNLGVETLGIAANSGDLLGISMRMAPAESGIGSSNTPTVDKGQIGAYITDGSIYVKVLEDCTRGGTVFVDDDTGSIYASAGTGRTEVTAYKFEHSANANSVVSVKLN